MWSAARAAPSHALESHTALTPDGWALGLIRVVRGGSRVGPPVLFVPGYGMNAWIVQYHPSGRSFADVLLEAGLDPWGVDLRGTCTSRRTSPSAPLPSFDDQATIDLPAVLSTIRNLTGHERVHVIGCSLGGSLLFAHLALAPEPGVDRMVAIASPLTWEDTLARRAVAALLSTVGQVPLTGTRDLTRHLLPIAARVAPSLLSMYLNPRITDIGDPGALTQTVEDPMPSVHRALARWMRSELRIDGRAVAPALRRFERPMLVLYGSGDGIVPMGPALSVVHATGGPVRVARVEHPRGEPVGHADLFISEIAPERVFEPSAEFLAG